MAFGYPPKKRKKFNTDSAPEVFMDMCKKAFLNLNWQIIEDTPYILRAETPYTWMSEKDIFSVILQDREVYIESRYGGPGGGWDYGKNSRNIKNFLQELEKMESSNLFV